jgi:hypothetical protein
MLKDLKAKIIHSLAMKMDTMQLNMKREEVEKSLVIFCPKCRKKHGNKNFENLWDLSKKNLLINVLSYLH